jgi:predicted nucleic acid-binding protein
VAPRSQRTAPQQVAHSLILDAGAVIDAAAGRQRTLAVIAAAREEGVRVLVPAVVVAETVRGSGPRDARVNLLLRGVSEITPSTEDRARIAGALIGTAGGDATIDALVVAEAVGRGGGVILTGDVVDLRRLATGHPEVVVQGL